MFGSTAATPTAATPTAPTPTSATPTATATPTAATAPEAESEQRSVTHFFATAKTFSSNHFLADN